ncbi:MAG: hypothetical protein SWI22_01065 [Pseudomonadota bacterium]|nr:hypothetical protein [Pseudomonadota bacterium]
MPSVEPRSGDAFLQKAEVWRLRASQAANAGEREKFLHPADQYLRLAQLTERHPPGSWGTPPERSSEEAK